MSSTELVARVPSSANYLMASCKSQEAMAYSLCEVRSHRIRGSIMRSNNSGDRGPLEGPPPNSHREDVPVRRDKFCRRLAAEI